MSLCRPLSRENALMQEEPQTNIFDANPLMKEVPGHLFRFEEKIFGMSLQQLLTDLGALTGSFSLTGSLPIIPHIIVSVLITLLTMAFVHRKIQGLPLGYWFYLLMRSKMMPSQTTWQSIRLENTSTKHKQVPSIQATWIPIDTVHQGIGEQCVQRNKTEVVRY